MLVFITRRILQLLVTAVVLSFFCYYLLTLMPGDPIDVMASANPNITSDDIARLRSMYDLDKPVWFRYGNWAKEILSGNLGYSRTYNIPVVEIVGPRIVNTLFLTVTAILISVLVGVAFGLVAGVRHGSRFDYAVNFFAFAAFSIPAFWLAILLIIVFAVWLPWLPAGGTYTIGVEGNGLLESFGDRIKYLVLPVTTLAAIQTGTFARYARSSMIEVLQSDFMRTARAKGVSEWRVLYIHGFRNAVIPLITVVSLSIGFVFSGALLTETVFAFQGMGKLLYDSILANDFNVAMICLMLSMGMVLVMSMVADILYGFADPRVSVSRQGER